MPLRVQNCDSAFFTGDLVVNWSQRIMYECVIRPEVALCGCRDPQVQELTNQRRKRQVPISLGGLIHGI